MKTDLSCSLKSTTSLGGIVAVTNADIVLIHQNMKEKYQGVTLVPGEDLNLERMLIRTIYNCWINTMKYPNVMDIAKAVGVTDRQIYRISKENKFPSRK